MSNMSDIEIVPLDSIQPDSNNANRGTERGTYMLRRSLEKLGAGRSILLDKNGKIIAGNKTAESASDIGIEDVILVRTKGNQLVAVMREDLDLDDPTGQARELAYADNRVGQISLDFDFDVIQSDLAVGVDLGDWWQGWELEGMKVPDLPDENHNSEFVPEQFAIVIECDDEKQQLGLLERLVAEGLKCRALLS